jgi:hypothetical protein
MFCHIIPLADSSTRQQHIKSKRHRKFAVDPSRYKELDRMIRRLERVSQETRLASEAEKAPVRAAARERYFQRIHELVADLEPDSPGHAQSSPDRHVSGRYQPERAGMAMASDDDPDRTLSSSLGRDAPDPAQFFEHHSGSSGPPYTEGGTTTTDTSACITPVDDLGVMAALGGEMSHHGGAGVESSSKQKEVIVISSDTAALESSFEIALAGSAGTAYTGVLDRFNHEKAQTGTRLPHRGTPMPCRVFDMGIGGGGSTDPADPESEALADLLRRRKSHALAQLAQTSEREDDSDGLEILV